jgi:type VI secretion system protein ImpC
MAKPLSFGNIEVNLTAGSAPSPAIPAPGGSFRIAILGDFSGRASRGLRETGPALAARKPVRVDRDNFDEVLAKLAGHVNLPVAGAHGSGIGIFFKELDDFRPERIVHQVGVFESLRETRRKLSNPATFAATAAEMGSWPKPKTGPSPPPAETRTSPSAVGVEPPANLLEQILGETASRPSESVPMQTGVDWNAFLHNVVSPYLIPRADPRQAELLAQVDEATAALLRSVMHHPSFQGLEAAWRALYFLVRRLDSDGPLKLFLLDISRAEVAADLQGVEDLRSTGLYRLLVEQTVGTPGAEPWGLVTGNYTFGPTPADVELLGRLARIARQAGAPFLAGADPAIVGCKALDQTPDPDDWHRDAEPDNRQAWSELRRLPEATFLGLALPRFLLRLPYGKETDPAEGLEFEEMPQGAGHGAYLWGNPAFACTTLLGQAFNQYGWNLRPGMVNEIDSLPLHIYTQDGETAYKPCAEVVLSHRAADVLLDNGLMPLLSIQGRDSVRLAGFRSVAEGGKPLAGRWK